MEKENQIKKVICNSTSKIIFVRTKLERCSFKSAL